MFCDDKDSQKNAKRIKNQWDKLSWSDKVSVGIDWSIINQPSLECFQLTDFFLANIETKYK